MFSLLISFIACSEYTFHSPTNINHRPEDELNGFTDGLTEEVATGTETPVSYTVEFAERYEASIELEVSSVDIAFALDTTCSMSEEAAALAREFSDIVDSLSESIPDAAYGFATFDDYNFYGLGSSSDRPFSLHNQITTDLPWIQYSLNYITIHNGEDVPESSMEALYQSLTGMGYNQSGEGVFNPGSDVPPFIAQAGDAFGGTYSGSFNPAVPGTGTIGGFGFREGSLPVIVYATDAPMRDADLGDTTPGAVSNPAGSTDVVHASDDLGARLIGISTQSTAPMSQMNDLALRTGSLYDADGEGINNDPLVFHWTGSSEAFRNTIVDAVEGLLGSVHFETVSAEIKGNVYGFHAVVDPPLYHDVAVGEGGLSLDFQVLISGEVASLSIEQVFPMTLEIYGDGSALLGTKDVTVIVPPVANE